MKLTLPKIGEKWWLRVIKTKEEAIAAFFLRYGHQQCPSYLIDRVNKLKGR